jgi:hypothetical protein
MRATTKRRLDKLQLKEDEPIEILGVILTRREWNEVFERVRATPPTMPLKFPPGTAERSQF